MKVLVLGGTKFVGRHLVETLLSRGHRVVLFHRGRTGADLFPGVERLLGDRDGGLDALGGRSFDAVVDVSGYVPRLVRAAAERLSGFCERYLFISTISVYGMPARPGVDEEAAVDTLTDFSREEITGATYGPLKAACELEARRAFGERLIVVRPGVVAGPHDDSHRFAYWPQTLAAGGRILAPAIERPVQWIDARDLAAFAVRLLEGEGSGIYNAVGPAQRMTLRAMVEALDRAVPGAGRRELEWLDEAQLLARGLAPWRDLPFWNPADAENFMTVGNAKALSAGLALRALEETALDLLPEAV